MANVQVAMLVGQAYTLLRDAVFTHPTMSEGLEMVFARVPKRRDATVEESEPARNQDVRTAVNGQSGTSRGQQKI